jgi:hypothetical protein
VVLLKRGFGRQTRSLWRFSQKTQAIPQQVIKAMPVLSTRYSELVIRRQELELGPGVALFTTDHSARR